MISELTIVVSRRAQLSALRHLAQDLRVEAPELAIHGLCPPDLVADVTRCLPSGAAVAALPGGARLRLARRLHTFLLNLFAADDFSPFFRRRMESAFHGKRLRALALRGGRRLTPKLQGPALNRLLTRVLSAVHGRPTLPTRRVVVLTKCDAPHLLCNRRHEVVALLDGWDHPTTSPAGYWTRAVAAWNDDLAEDWRRKQGASAAMSGYPYRFAYLLRGGGAPAPPAGARRRGGIALLYAMATFPSRSALDQRRHEEEMEVVRILFDWLRQDIASFEVKPHPIGPAGHLDRLAEACPGIVVHPYETSGASTYDLTDAYNQERRRTLGSADLVIGIWTTFLLDAAMAGRAIALVDLPDDTRFEALWTAQLGLHVHHLRSRVGAVVRLRADGPAFGGGADGSGAGFEAFVDEAAASGRRVATWVLPNAEPGSLVRALLADIL